MAEARTIPDHEAESECISPNSFEFEKHFYTKVLNATIHPMVSYFVHLKSEQIIDRYCHLHPRTDRDALREVLNYSPQFLHWAGADLFHITTEFGNRDMVVIETNSSPSGQKSMPLFAEYQEQGGYRLLAERTFAPAVRAHRFKEGGLAVLYDKNYMENSGYAAAIADVFEEDVFLVPFYDDGTSRKNARFSNGVLEIKHGGTWRPIRAAFRYVTQKPWNRIPLESKTLIFNSVIACLAGGRNKLVASMAYDIFNAEFGPGGLEVRSPETITNVSKVEIPLILRQFGGHAVVKVPYSNAGQGVFTITSKKELDTFMKGEHHYEQYIVQSLIGNYRWSSRQSRGRFYHVGTVPDKLNRIFVSDVRMMISASADGFRPLAIYARRAREPLSDVLSDTTQSWDMLGTNLSIASGKNQWDTETTRLLLMDRRDFNRLGLGIDELINGFIQTVLATVAIDRMAKTLVTQKGKFRYRLFESIDADSVLLNELAPRNYGAN